LGKYAENYLLIIFGLNPDINKISIKDAIYIHYQYVVYNLPRNPRPKLLLRGRLAFPPHQILGVDFVVYLGEATAPAGLTVLTRLRYGYVASSPQTRYDLFVVQCVV